MRIIHIVLVVEMDIKEIHESCTGSFDRFSAFVMGNSAVVLRSQRSVFCKQEGLFMQSHLVSQHAEGVAQFL